MKTVLFPLDAVFSSRKAMPDFNYLRTEMKRKGVTLQLLWEEYRSIHPDGYSRRQFFELYRRQGKTIYPVMRFEHKAGEKLFVDFSGDTPAYVGRDTGQLIPTELFVAVIGASSRIYALAVASQQIPGWTKAHIGAFEYYGGLPEVVVPDQLKSTPERMRHLGASIGPQTATMIEEIIKTLSMSSIPIVDVWGYCVWQRSAAMRGYSACYIRLPRLLQEMQIARGDGVMASNSQSSPESTCW